MRRLFVVSVWTLVLTSTYGYARGDIFWWLFPAYHAGHHQYYYHSRGHHFVHVAPKMEPIPSDVGEEDQLRTIRNNLDRLSKDLKK